MTLEDRRHLTTQRLGGRDRDLVRRRVLQGAYRRGNSYQSVLARLDSPASFDAFKNWLTTNPQLDVQVRRESEYYAAQSTVDDEPDPGHRLHASRR